MWSKVNCWTALLGPCDEVTGLFLLLHFTFVVLFWCFVLCAFMASLQRLIVAFDFSCYLYMYRPVASRFEGFDRTFPEPRQKPVGSTDDDNMLNVFIECHFTSSVVVVLTGPILIDDSVRKKTTFVLLLFFCTYCVSFFNIVTTYYCTNPATG